MWLRWWVKCPCRSILGKSSCKYSSTVPIRTWFCDQFALTGNQCSSFKKGVMFSLFRVQVTVLAAVFWTSWRCLSCWLGISHETDCNFLRNDWWVGTGEQEVTHWLTVFCGFSAGLCSYMLPWLGPELPGINMIVHRDLDKKKCNIFLPKVLSNEHTGYVYKFTEH